MTRRLLPYAGLVLLALTLTSCHYLFPPKVHYVRHGKTELAKARFPANVYVRSLTLAQLGELTGTPDADAMHKLDLYTAKAPIMPAPQTVVVLEYKQRKNDRLQTVVAPVNREAEHGQADLLAIMNRLSATPYTLSDSHIALITVAPVEALALAKTEADEQPQKLDQAQQQMLGSAESPTPVEEARLQLMLANFFTAHRFRDAAYISVDNVKRLLATASQAPANDSEAIKDLSARLETLEGQLHRVMPYTLTRSANP